MTDSVGRGDVAPNRDRCRCLGQRLDQTPRSVKFHRERQDTEAAGWRHLLELIEEAADDRREEFRPLVELSAGERRQVVTLPSSIGKLTGVRHLVLHGSNPVRIPPEIGAMESLEEFTPYTSYRLHWFPYELTRCPKLRRSTVSTRAVYGNGSSTGPASSRSGSRCVWPPTSFRCWSTPAPAGASRRWPSHRRAAFRHLIAAGPQSSSRNPSTDCPSGCGLRRCREG